MHARFARFACVMFAAAAALLPVAPVPLRAANEDPEIARLAERLGSDDPRVREESFAALRKMGPAVAGPLAKIVESSKNNVQVAMADRLVGLYAKGGEEVNGLSLHLAVVDEPDPPRKGPDTLRFKITLKNSTAADIRLDATGLFPSPHAFEGGDVFRRIDAVAGELPAGKSAAALAKDGQAAPVEVTVPAKGERSFTAEATVAVVKALTQALDNPKVHVCVVFHRLSFGKEGHMELDAGRGTQRVRVTWTSRGRGGAPGMFTGTLRSEAVELKLSE